MSAPDPAELARSIIDRCHEAGFAAAGVCEARPSDFEAELRAWLEAGQHGSMGWLEENVETRADPTMLLEGARSVVMVADLYATRDDNVDPKAPQGSGRIARYARGRDYHKVIKKRLHALCDELRAAHPDAGFRAFTDTAPVLEREQAARCGIGWTAKHTLTIHPRLGSYLLLGGFVTTLELEPPAEQVAVSDHCGTCTRCIQACPTGAISPYSVDATRCISYLTIERREPIDERFDEPIGDWLFGCDICQEVCPHNSPREAATSGPSVNAAYEPKRRSFDLLKVLGWTEDDRRRALAGTAMTRAKLDMLKRNALIAAGNQVRRAEQPALRARIGDIAEDDAEPEMVRQTAARVRDRLP